MTRHKLSLRTPENLSVARLQMSTYEVRDEFFDTLTAKISELKVGPAQICNMDESGIQIVQGQKDCSKQRLQDSVQKQVGRTK